MKSNLVSATNNSSKMAQIASWIVGIIVLAIGIANVLFIHPVPGVIAILIALLLLPVLDGVLRRYLGFSIPPMVKIIIGLLVIWFTLGVSDLGDLIDG